MSRTSSTARQSESTQRPAGGAALAGRSGSFKEAVGPEGDAFEREADRIADVFARSSGPAREGRDWSAAVSSGADLPIEIDRVHGEEEPKIRRAPKKTGAKPSADTADAPAPQARPGHRNAARLLAEDDAPVSGGQMRKSAFLAALRTELCAVVDKALSGTGKDSQGCPWIDHWLGYYAERSAPQIEAAIQRYAPETADAAEPRDYIRAVGARVRRSAQTFARTGEITGVPQDIPGASMMGGGGALAAFGGMFFKARPGGARPMDPGSVRDQLGNGQSLPGGVRGRMESAFGTSFSGVRLHNDTGAARLSDRLNARAFTIGSDVAFAAGEWRPGTPAGDALIAHELAHVVQQDGASGPAPKGAAEPAGLEEEADRSALSAVSKFYGATQDGLGAIARNTRLTKGSGLRLQRCKSAEEKAREAEIGRLGGLQYDFLEKQRKEEEERKRKEAEEEARKNGLPPPVTPPTVTVDDIIRKETKADDPPKPADAWTKLDAKTQADWKKRAAKAWTDVIASVVGTELENVVKGKTLNFDPEDALKQSYFGAQNGNKLDVGMRWVELAEKDPKNVWPNVAHELGGHFEYGQAYATEIMMNTLEKLPEAERKKWKTDPNLRQKFFDVYEYAETEIFAELRERHYSKPETGTAPPNPTDDPDTDVPRQLNVLKKNLHPEVAKAVVAELQRRVNASTSILERDKKFFAEQVKAVFGTP